MLARGLLRRAASTLSVAMRGAPIRGPILTDGVGVVDRGGHGFDAGDLEAHQQLEHELSSDRKTLAAELEEKKEAVRNG